MKGCSDKMNDENYQNKDNSTGVDNDNNADNIDIENESIIDANNIDELDEPEEIDDFENEQNISEIFNENSLEYDDTVFSDESVVLIQYTPSEMNVIESEYTKDDCIKVLSDELNTINKVDGDVEEKKEEKSEDENSSEDAENTKDADADAEQDAEETPEELEAKLKKRRRRKIIRRILKILLIILCIIFIAVGAVMVYYYDVLNSLVYDNLKKGPDISIEISTPTDVATPDDSPSSQVSSTESTSSIVSDWTVEISDTKLLDDPMVLNIMLFGSDTRYVGNTGNSDTMILLSVDNRHQKIKFTSFMRDTWINIPGYGPNKMNASYSYGGPSLAIETIERNYGIKIDRYAVVDFSSFIDIIDTLGGIDIELTDFEIDYINMQLYDNRQSDTRYTLKDSAGIVHLNGQQALWHARNRDSEMSDFDRTSRQRQVINTVMDQFSNASISTILDAVSKVGPLITTNLKKSEITTLVANSLTYLKYSREEYTLPDIYGGNIFIDNAYPTPYGELSVLLIPDWKQARRDLASFIFEDSLVGGTTSGTSSAASSQNTSAGTSASG
ncbi:MAG: LCP family protein [Acutalibacteraceae bacterium]